MATNLRFLIVLLMIVAVTTLSIPPVKAIWHYVDAKSQIADSLLSKNISALMWSSSIKWKTS